MSSVSSLSEDSEEFDIDAAIDDAASVASPSSPATKIQAHQKYYFHDANVQLLVSLAYAHK